MVDWTFLCERELFLELFVEPAVLPSRRAEREYGLALSDAGVAELSSAVLAWSAILPATNPSAAATIMDPANPNN